MLLELITPEKIFISDQKLSFAQAVQKLSEPMLAAGSITPAYVGAMIESLEKNGPYFVLADRFAMPHARPQDGVSRLDMSLLVCRNEVDVGGQPVNLFIALAAADSTSHIQAISQLARIFWRDDAVDRLCAGNTPQEIYSCLCALAAGGKEEQ